MNQKPVRPRGDDQKSIVIDFVRHGQTPSTTAGLIDTGVPGPGPNAEGLRQADTIGAALAVQGPYAGIFSSELTRTRQTAMPLAGLMGGAVVEVLPGLNEISAGAFDGLPKLSRAGVLYLVAPIAWALGFPLVPMLAPGSTDFNGVVFGQNFSDALQSIYSNAMANQGVVALDGKTREAAFSSAVSIDVGTLMNVNNPEPIRALTHTLSTTGTLVVQGNPKDGWTMVSRDGRLVPPASLPTQLFVDLRDLITPPQFAAHNILQAALTGDPTTIVNAIGSGVHQIVRATAVFPVNVGKDVARAVYGALSRLLP